MFITLVVWSANVSIVKVGMDHVHPAAFTAARFLIAVVMTWSVSIALHGRRALIPPRSRVLGVAAIGLGCNQLFFAFGLNLTTAVDSSLIGGLSPVFVGAMVMVTTRRRLAARELVALALGLGGMAAVVLAMPGQAGGSVIGNLINLGVPLSYAFFLVYTVDDAVGVPVTRLIPWILSAPLVVLLPAASIDFIGSRQDWVGALPELLAAGLLATAFAYGATLWVRDRLGVTTTAVYNYFQPPLGAAIGAIFLGEPYKPLQLGGTVLILLAAYLASARRAGERGHLKVGKCEQIDKSPPDPPTKIPPTDVGATPGRQR
jgi:drug/metabolite transporter (DMT)-like permease